MAEEKSVKIPKFTNDPHVVQIAQSTDQVGATWLTCLKSDGTIHMAKISGLNGNIVWIQVTPP